MMHHALLGPPRPIAIETLIDCCYDSIYISKYVYYNMIHIYTWIILVIHIYMYVIQSPIDECNVCVYVCVCVRACRFLSPAGRLPGGGGLRPVRQE